MNRWMVVVLCLVAAVDTIILNYYGWFGTLSAYTITAVVGLPLAIGFSYFYASFKSSAEHQPRHISLSAPHYNTVAETIESFRSLDAMSATLTVRLAEVHASDTAAVGNRCDYCRLLVPKGTPKCPSCGAPQ
jgi:hypothetical protein